MNIKAKTIDEKLITIDVKLLEKLSAQMRGKVITPKDSLYEETRKIWNGIINIHPAFIVQCGGTDDVIEAVRFAKKYKLLFSIRGGGHNIAGRSLKENVMLLDLSKMNSVQVNSDARTAVVGPGARL